MDDRDESQAPILTLAEAKRLLADKVQELVHAEPGRIPALTIEVQQYRVAVMLLREIENEITDQNTYREVALLNRLLTGRDIESEAAKKKSVEDGERAARVLEAKGISPESAHRMMKALSSVLTPGGATGEPNEPRRAALTADDDPLADEPDETAD